ncbi:MAG TPA: DUF4325 domain-containing protein [Thiotrichales bacterium]|nr:DUF4325 domain-containing protein [Thiotrichales bacterium]
MIDKERFRRRALALAAEDGRQLGARLAREFGISRAAASARLRTLVREGLLTAEGSTRARVHRPAVLEEGAACFPTRGLSEDIVWRVFCRPLLTRLPENVIDIWHYGVTEMVNNVIDHSGAPYVEISLRRKAMTRECHIRDRGEGIFHKIQRALDLFDPREAVLELAKGKFTTDPDHHTGEGIFFSSRVFDRFEIHSRGLVFLSGALCRQDMIEERDGCEIEGTLVVMTLADDSRRTLREIMDQFAPPEEYGFSRTVIPIRLAAHEGEKLVSRSQARRITFRIDRFEDVALDFEGVEEIGQAFADEIFRVFARRHPRTRLTPINMTPRVEAMIRRAQARGHGND